jgi:hypothetical protein
MIKLFSSVIKVAGIVSGNLDSSRKSLITNPNLIMNPDLKRFVLSRGS